MFVMSHVGLLLEGERVLYESRRHPIVLAGPTVVALVAVLVALALGFLITPNTTRDVLDLILGGVAIVFVLRALWRTLQWMVQRVIVTERRVLRISGVVGRRVGSLPVGRITDIETRRSGLGRLLGFGDVVVETAGAVGGHYLLDHLPRLAVMYDALSHGRKRAVRTLEPLVPADQQDTGPLPRVVV